MFGWFSRSPYRNMRVEDLARHLARGRAVTAATFRELSGRSQLNELADHLVREYWTWCRTTKDPLGRTLTLGALAIAVEEEAIAHSADMDGANLADIFKVNTAIWHLLEQRGLVDALNASQEMPQRLKERIDAIIELNIKEAGAVAGQFDPKVPGLIVAPMSTNLGPAKSDGGPGN